jgi:hypothetical protein
LRIRRGRASSRKWFWRLIEERLGKNKDFFFSPDLLRDEKGCKFTHNCENQCIEKEGVEV